MRLRREAGFTYVGLIVLVTIIGLVGAATLKADALLRRAAAEQELLEIGAAFSAALTSYAEATPRGQPPQPPSLEELLKDPRFPGTRRHLRKIFVDPVTGKAEWGIVWLNKGSGIDGKGSGVVAVYSLSQSKPLKQANFDERFQNLEGREHISDWKFAASGQTIVQGQILAQGAPGQPSLFQPQPNGTPAGQPTLFPAPGGTSSDPARPAGGQPPVPILPPEAMPPSNRLPEAIPPPVPSEPAQPPSEDAGGGHDERGDPPPAQDAGR